MAKFQFGPYSDLDANITARVGSAATSGKLVDNDKGKFMKLAGDSQYNLCAAGDPIEGVLMAIEPATQDGWSMGTVNLGGESRIKAICDGLQATPGTGDLNVGDFVVCGTVVAAGTALTSTTGPKVCKATFQPAVGTGVGISKISFPLALNKVANGDLVTNYTPGFNFKVVDIAYVVGGTPVTTAAKLANVHVEIGATAITGGVVALTSAACTPMGKVVAGSAITALNTGTATDTISLVAADTTAFVEGDGEFVVTLQNLDTVAAISNIKGWRVTSLGSAGAVGDTCIIQKVS